MIERITRPNRLNATGSDNKEGAPRRTVEFLIGGEVKSFDRDSVMEDFAVDNIVRMQESDFSNIDPTPGSLFLHFNIEKTDNEPERHYLIVRIEQGGVPGKEPVLSLDGALIAECLEAENYVSYDALTPDQLAQSLPGLRDMAGLQDAMVARYGPSRGYSREQVIDRKLGYTLFKIVGPAPTSNVAR